MHNALREKGMLHDFSAMGPGRSFVPRYRSVGAEVTAFLPLVMPQGTTGDTGMWFCPDLGKASEILPVKTVWATKESVTGGVAMEPCFFEKGAPGHVAYERNVSAGGAESPCMLKGSLKLTLKGGTTAAEVGTAWQKLDFPCGTSRDRPRLGFQLVVAVQGPIENYRLTRSVGTESPTFDPNGRIEPQAGPDTTLWPGTSSTGPSTWPEPGSARRPGSRSVSLPWATR